MKSPQFLYYQPNWSQAKKRLEAFWELTEVDRPCIDVRASKLTEVSRPADPENLEDFYFDPDYVSKKWHYLLESTYFGGEAVPTGGFLHGGWTLGFGSKAKFDRHTVWHPAIMSSIDDPIDLDLGPGDPWRQKITKVIERLLQDAKGKFLVGPTGQLPVNDLLPLIRGSNDFLLDMAVNIDKCCQRMDELLPLWFENRQHFMSLVEKQDGYVSNWLGCWSKKFVMLTQSDMSCMISGEMFDRYVMREMDFLGERFERIWYHLDGPDAVRHAAKLLTRPYIKAIQYVAGSGVPPNGPHWMELYRQVQKAGRCLDLSAPLENMEFLIRHLRPEGLILRTCVETQEQADELLDNAVKWCGTDVHK